MRVAVLEAMTRVQKPFAWEIQAPVHWENMIPLARVGLPVCSRSGTVSLHLARFFDHQNRSAPCPPGTILLALLNSNRVITLLFRYNLAQPKDDTQRLGYRD